MNLSRAIAGVLATHSCRSPRCLFSLGSSFTAQQLASISSSPLKSTSETITEPKPEASSPGLSPSPATEAPAPPSLENYEKSSDLPLPKEIPFQPQIHDQMHLAPSPGLSSSPATGAPAPASQENYKKSSDLPRPKEIPFQPQIDNQMHLASSPPSLENYKKSLDLPRPKSIFFQPQILNQMHLVGYVGAPVQLQILPNGSCVAVSVITSKKIRGLLSFRIPVIFEGDLAQIAACHLKENDLIYVAGQLSGDAPSVAQEVSCTNIQIIADKLSFVHDGYSQSTPSFKANASKVGSQKSWDDLVLNPHDWYDNREAKLNGQINPNYPDFKNRTTSESLWLDRAPSWVSERLEGLPFVSIVYKKLPLQQSSEYLGEAGKSKQAEYTNASSFKNKGSVAANHSF